jgi:hypothetical protein
MHLQRRRFTVWVIKDTHEELRLKDLSPGERAEILDELVHDAKAAEASTINNSGEAAQIAYLLDEDAPAMPLLAVAGDPFDGLTVYAGFRDGDHREAFTDEHLDGSTWWYPQVVDANGAGR